MSRPLSAHLRAATGGGFEAVRNHILAAAQRVVSHAGLAATSTRAVAEEAGVGAGTIYNYFDNRVQLLAQSIVRHAHTRAAPLADLPSRAGEGTVEGNLLRFGALTMEILGELVPLFAATFSDAELLRSLREEFAADDPASRGGETLFQYLLAEQALGRIRPGADCQVAAAIILGVCHDHAFQHCLRGTPGEAAVPTAEISFIARTLTSGRG
ncbi:MAG: TetR/AcrR family transcriptional regulator [Chloroflexi bacterium]|nr:TetR/AcrR family transcriptional regulator [Chloroflexota bacterium]